MTSFLIDKQRNKVNAEWMSRPVDSFKKQSKNQPLALVLISMAQSPIFAYRLKRKLLSGPISGEAYRIRYEIVVMSLASKCFDQENQSFILAVKQPTHLPIKFA